MLAQLCCEDLLLSLASLYRALLRLSRQINALNNTIIFLANPLTKLTDQID